MKAYGKSPFLPTIYDYFEFKNTSFIVMEYIEGKPVGKGDFKRPSEKKMKNSVFKSLLIH